MRNAKPSAIILNGRKLAEKIKLDLKKKISQVAIKPGLAAILIGDDPASATYVALKEKASLEVGINFHQYLCNKRCASQATENDVLQMIDFLNRDPQITGIIIQLPLPENFHTDKILKAIDPRKDVDGFLRQDRKIIPPAVSAIIDLLQVVKMNLAGKKIAIIIKSDIFVNNLQARLRQVFQIKTIKIFHRLPKNLNAYDMVISGLGQPGIIKKNTIKNGAIVIDMGAGRLKGKLRGDADRSVAKKAAYLSPVPGGVGPLTVAHLLKNVYELSLDGQKTKK